LWRGKDNKEITEKEWQNRNVGNIKRLFKKEDMQQLCIRIRKMPQVRKKEVDLVSARGYFKGLLGRGSEMGLITENCLFRPEQRWKEELDREVREEIHKYLKKGK
jgi:hypothetical protein